MRSDQRYAEYLNPRLVALYDEFNALGRDGEFFAQLVDELSPASVIDLGCGTGLLTCQLVRPDRNVVGLDPSAMMLDVARRKARAECVRWIEGGHDRLKDLEANLVLMTSHVAQLFLDDQEWRAALRACYEALRPGGHLVFDSRNPLCKPWETWTRTMSERTRSTIAEGKTEFWYDVTGVEGDRVRYEIHYRFVDSGEELTSLNELVFRSAENIERALLEAGFAIDCVYGDWDRSLFFATSPEIVFVASRG